MKKLVCLLLTLAMVLCLVSCGKKEETKDTETTKTESTTAKKEETKKETETSTTEEESKSIFPLAEKTTFTLMCITDQDVEDMAEKIPLLQRLEEETNVHIEFQGIPKDNAMNLINAMFTSNTIGDAIMQIAIVISEADQMNLYETGDLIALEDYLTDPEVCPNFNERVISENPDIIAHISSPDGHIFTFPKYNAIMGNYIENPMWINKTWLDNLGLEVPTTVDELEEVLIAFRDNDCNGNGDPNDEIPLFFRDGENMSDVNTFLYMYGLGAKNSASDYNAHIVDGKVEYTPVTEAYREGITKLNEFWNEGLIWSEAFTGTSETFSATMKNDDATPLFGVMWRNTLPDKFYDQYVRISPISADGYEAQYWIHPGYRGAKGMCAITGACEQPEILAAWFDLFYTAENTIEANYGIEGEGWEYDAEGKVVTKSIDKDAADYVPVFIHATTNAPSGFTRADYADLYAVAGVNKIKMDNYECVKDAVPENFWPRPSMASDVASAVSELYPDISSYVNQKRAEWITGVADINAEWDGYLENLNKMKVDTFVENLQKAYDTYVALQ